jgi:plasmid stability protein
MTVNLSIKEVPEAVAARLRERAARNHRSLQGELMAIIESAVMPGEQGYAVAPDQLRHDMNGPLHEPSSDARLLRHRQGHKSIEQIAAEHLARFPKPTLGGPLAVDIIRQERDSR